MKKIIVIAAAILMTSATGAVAQTAKKEAKCKSECKQDCPKGSKDCVCVRTPDGGCVCVPKSHSVAVAKPIVKHKSNCPNTPDCVCD